MNKYKFITKGCLKILIWILLEKIQIKVIKSIINNQNL